MSDISTIEKALIITALGLTIGIGAYGIYKFKNRKEHIKMNRDKNTKGIVIENRKVKDILDTYFKEYLNEFKRDKLYTFYSWQLDVEEFKKEYIFNTKVIKSLIELDLNMEERKIAHEIMGVKINDICKLYGNNVRKVEEIEYKNFLQEYYELLGNTEALNMLKGKVVDDKDFQKYCNENEKRIKELVIRI